MDKIKDAFTETNTLSLKELHKLLCEKPKKEDCDLEEVALHKAAQGAA